MPKSDTLRILARRGAEARLEELKSELVAIGGEFPDLVNGRALEAFRTMKGAARRAGLEIAGATIRQAPAAAAEVPAAPRTRRHMTPAQRKAVSLRMRKYWAARRAGKA